MSFVLPVVHPGHDRLPALLKLPLPVHLSLAQFGNFFLAAENEIFPCPSRATAFCVSFVHLTPMRHAGRKHARAALASATSASVSDAPEEGSRSAPVDVEPPTPPPPPSPPSSPRPHSKKKAKTSSSSSSSASGSAGGPAEKPRSRPARTPEQRAASAAKARATRARKAEEKRQKELDEQKKIKDLEEAINAKLALSEYARALTTCATVWSITRNKIKPYVTPEQWAELKKARAAAYAVASQHPQHLDCMFSSYAYAGMWPGQSVGPTADSTSLEQLLQFPSRYDAYVADAARNNIARLCDGKANTTSLIAIVPWVEATQRDTLCRMARLSQLSAVSESEVRWARREDVKTVAFSTRSDLMAKLALNQTGDNSNNILAEAKSWCLFSMFGWAHETAGAWLSSKGTAPLNIYLPWTTSRGPLTNATEEDIRLAINLQRQATTFFEDIREFARYTTYDEEWRSRPVWALNQSPSLLQRLNERVAYRALARRLAQRSREVVFDVVPSIFSTWNGERVTDDLKWYITWAVLSFLIPVLASQAYVMRCFRSSETEDPVSVSPEAEIRSMRAMSQAWRDYDECAIRHAEACTAGLDCPSTLCRLYAGGLVANSDTAVAPAASASASSS